MYDAEPGPSSAVGEGGVVRGHGGGWSPRRPRWYSAPLAVATSVAGCSTLLGVVDPNQPGHYPGCPILAVTGLYCPGCGGLRAVHALTRGDVGGALDQNALFVLSLPLLVAGYLWWVRARWRQRPAMPGVPAVPARASYWVVGAVSVVMVGFAVLRNLPAFAVLAP